ncbi:thymidine kinase [Mycoplasma wenyonii str. Massachusetts]|uniref:Thymidine kinase n=1 Tax=Mycoplasma wenyonii (strain Massachusetts) TaxID=1197325 RepID=I6ZI61_MYCWM|nr:thymidine kinase [Mycoplasma wenyonii]AFN64855.1 thymidine kinase [Mycoplasma wenyonii str. Massachusetts]
MPIYSNSQSASLTVICGPMKSGKSKELFLIIDRLNYQKRDYKIFKPKLDTRNPDTISSRYLSLFNSAVIIDETNPAEILEHIPKELEKPLTVLVDEAHFFSRKLISVVKSLLIMGVNVVISGLDCDANFNTFGPMGDLLAIATNIKKLNSVCEFCFNSANLSALKDSVQSFERGNILIGNDQYLALCLNCYLKHTNYSERVQETPESLSS